MMEGFVAGSVFVTHGFGCGFGRTITDPTDPDPDVDSVLRYIYILLER
jgi:hypothetical protein